jgi:predicted hydrolase (HD superfamily)
MVIVEHVTKKKLKRQLKNRLFSARLDGEGMKQINDLGIRFILEQIEDILYKFARKPQGDSL